MRYLNYEYVLLPLLTTINVFVFYMHTHKKPIVCKINHAENQLKAHTFRVNSCSKYATFRGQPDGMNVIRFFIFCFIYFRRCLMKTAARQHNLLHSSFFRLYPTHPIGTNHLRAATFRSIRKSVRLILIRAESMALFHLCSYS